MPREKDARYQGPGRRVSSRAAPSGAPPAERGDRRRASRSSAITGSPASFEAPPQPTERGFVESALDSVRDEFTEQLGFQATETPEFVPDPYVQQTSAGTAVVHLHQQYQGIPLFEMSRNVQFPPTQSAQRIIGDSASLPDPLTTVPALSLETYWLTGYRPIRFDGAGDARRQLLEKLWKAGLLVAAESSVGPFRAYPATVKFFHDSIQSFLTARALEAANRTDTEWLVLEEAAGHPRLVRAQSDLVTTGGSEVFQFCAYTFESERLRSALSNHLMRWADQHDVDLRKSDIARSLDVSVRESFEQTVTTTDAPGQALRKAIDLCRPFEQSGLTAIVALYAGLAPILWPYIARVRASRLARTA